MCNAPDVQAGVLLIDKPETCASDAWKTAAFTEWTNRMRPHLDDVLRVVLRRYQRKVG